MGLWKLFYKLLLRGGGSGSEFEVFNSFRLLEKWIDKKAYKISALGHTDNRAYLDIFSDFSADTPTDAGIFIRKRIKEFETLRDFSIQAEKHKKDIQELNKQIQENQEKAQNEIKNIMERAKTEIWAVNKAKDETLKDYLNNLEKEERETRELSNSLSVSVNELKEAGEKLKFFKIVAGVVGVVVALLLKIMF